MGPRLAHEGLVRAVAISPDGTAALTGAAGGDNYAAAWLWQLPPEQPLGKTIISGGAQLVSLHFSRDAKVLASGATDGSAHLLAMPGGRRLGAALVAGGQALLVAVSPHGRTLLTGNEKGSVHLWDAARGRERLSLPLPHEKYGTLRWVNGVAFLADGRTFLVGRRDGLVQFYRTATGRPFGRPLRTKRIPIWSVDLSADGQRLVLVLDNGAQLWDRRTGRLAAECSTRPGMYQATFYPDGKKVLLFNQNEAHVWDLASNRVTGAPRFHPEKGIWSVTFTPDGRGILISSSDGFTRLWDVATGKSMGPPLNSAGYGAVATDSKGQLLAAGGHDGRINLWPAPQPLEGTVERIRLWIEVITRMELETEETTRPLTEQEVQERRRRLQKLGGPPHTSKQ
jgi:WD40 repeat protein